MSVPPLELPRRALAHLRFRTCPRQGRSPSQSAPPPLRRPPGRSVQGTDGHACRPRRDRETLSVTAPCTSNVDLFILDLRTAYESINPAFKFCTWICSASCCEIQSANLNP
ncbi:hypothetical protein BS78_K004700 [Paspalum vaginatum]|uniref:Uncharacterized protein n=1 Tax=Paspalum vaginatum TaxID=158149 RepID=A0A9W7XDI6_9POAL|nr:hypothetical protein BS78_K004700 [Paspalum vaginatum]